MSNGNNSTSMGPIVGIIAIVAILAVAYFAVQMLQQQNPSEEPGIDIDINPNPGPY